MKMNCRLIPVLTVTLVASACATFKGHVKNTTSPEVRSSILERSEVWSPTNVASRNLRLGPQGPGAFAPGATVYCTHLDKKLGGNSPKFLCRIGKDDVVKVKVGETNGEVEGEVLGTRLLWALGFGADRMYPVSVVCYGCPVQLGGIGMPSGERRFDPAAIERRMAGAEWPREDESGWSWEELDHPGEKTGSAARAHRDALKLLAVFIQHTDTKPEQQEILCLGQAKLRGPNECRRPFLMISDVGVTFGRANMANSNDTGSVNLEGWRRTPVWKNDSTCTGNLPRSLTGTLNDPVISEPGRRFLADLLNQLSDRQIRDLFEVSRVDVRLRAPDQPASGRATVDEWVTAFKEKRQQITSRSCA